MGMLAGALLGRGRLMRSLVCERPGRARALWVATIGANPIFTSVGSDRWMDMHVLYNHKRNFMVPKT